MGRTVIAGVDAGTTSVKALLMTPEGVELVVGRAPTAWTSVPTGAETTAGTITGAARAALADALTQLPDAQVAAIGVASMAESGVLTDAGDRPLADIIAWHDTRDGVELSELIDDLGGEEFSRRTGLPLWTQWAVTKHRWLRTHHPETRAAVRRYNIAEWIVRDLGGAAVSEASLSSRTGWLDLHTGQPYAESLAWSGAPASLLGEIVEAGTPAGRVSADGPLSALDEFDSAGTAEAVLRTSAPGLPDATVLALTRDGVTVGRHAAPGRWCLLGATQGGLILGKVLAALGVDRDGMPALDAAAGVAAYLPGAVRLGPGAGDVTIDEKATPGEIWRAATAAVTEQAAALSARLTQASGPRVDLVVAGGWTNSAAVRAAKRETFGDYLLPRTSEAGCRGAALLAGIAAGFWSDLDSVPCPS